MSKSQAISEQEILKGCLKKDITAQREFYLCYGPSLMSVCSRYVSPLENAEELFHDSLLKIFDNIYKYNGKGSFGGWARRVTVNVCLDFIRTKKNKIRIQYLEEQLTDVAVDDEENEFLMENAELVHKELTHLPEQQKVVFNLYVLDDFSHKEIANQLKISEIASRSLLMRAKNNLKEKLGVKTATETYNGQ